jgi:quercetin dioxygenase-like cupin family protein
MERCRAPSTLGSARLGEEPLLPPHRKEFNVTSTGPTAIEIEILPQAPELEPVANEPPAALHRGESDLPFVSYQEGVTFQLLQVNLDTGFFVVRVRGEPGRTIQRHKHTGQVFAFTGSGSWRYLEYPEINTAGSYLYEPAGSTHTLHFPETNTEITDVRFVLHGANLNLDSEGNVESILDAATALEVYRAACRDLGLAAPDVIGA